MAVQFPPGSYTPEKPYTDPAGVAWVVWRDGVVDGAWHARPVKSGNPYNVMPFADAGDTGGYFAAGTAADVLAMVNARAANRMAALANERNTGSSTSGGAVVLLLIALFLLGKKGR